LYFFVSILFKATTLTKSYLIAKIIISIENKTNNYLFLLMFKQKIDENTNV